jgi:hypothetical protein
MPSRLPFVAALALLLVSAAPASGAPLTWSLGDDFRVSPNQANPSPDGHGNDDVWHYMQTNGPVDQVGSYSLLPTFDVIDGLGAWRDSHGDTNGNFPILPFVASDGCGAAARTHPAAAHDGVARWQSPVEGTVRVLGRVSDADPGGGDGVAWYILDTTGAVLDSGAVKDGSETFDLSVPVSVGDSVHAVVAKNGETFEDSTDLTFIVTTGETDSVNGCGTIARNNSFAFDATSAPDGSGATGVITFTTPSSTIAGGVVCLNVVGDRATIVYEDTDPPVNPAGTVGGIIRVEDGTPYRQTNGRLTRKKLNAYAAGGCPSPVGPALNPLISGDIAVVDAP